MEDYRPNQIARTFAVCALIGAFILVIIVIASNGGSSDSGGGGGSQTTEASGPTAQGQRAVERGVWIVRSGDTLAQISEDTGIDQDELIQINPDLDPQALIEGQRIALR